MNLPDYLNDLLPGRAFAAAPSPLPSQAYVVWEQGPSSDSQPLYAEEGRKKAVKALTLSAYLHFPGTDGFKPADALTRQIVEAENTVTEHPGLSVISLDESSTVGPIWNDVTKRWVSTVRFTLLYFKT
ncbi:hypothetical protein [Deinococcus hopiensis]|uniref:Uncharacterized protein n=1 Tax=Deinococcus hopiensis KR-140 TaxID=695939 RepID=A0A1W1V761_9DEIO|nr:hypothetical protein [Deinococcus hopiensis]SMB89198.1 hypothetical protein SAMN00790413_00305 [Deinococcus hopiensis KR-140]